MSNGSLAWERGEVIENQGKAEFIEFRPEVIGYFTTTQAQHILDGLLSLKNPNLPQSIRSAAIDECHAFVAGAFQVLGLTKRGER